MTRKVTSFVSIGTGLIFIILAGMWIVVTLQIEGYLWPTTDIAGEINPLYSFGVWTYYFVLSLLCALATAFLTIGALLRQGSPSLSPARERDPLL